MCSQPRVRCRIVRLQSHSKLEQTRYAGGRLGVAKVGLDTTHGQLSVRIGAGREHLGDKRARLDGVAERRASAVRLNERNLTSADTAIRQCGAEQPRLESKRRPGDVSPGAEAEAPVAPRRREDGRRGG